MSMKSHFDCGSEQWHAPSQSWINHRTHFEFVRNGEESIARPPFASAIFPMRFFDRRATCRASEWRGEGDEKCFYRASDVVLPTTKGKTGREIDTWRLPDISAEKCCNGGWASGHAGDRRKKERRGEGEGARVASTKESLPSPRARARKVNVFPAVNTRRTERRPGVGRLVTWSTVNDRESASRMRRYAADPDARNVIAARPFPSILGDPRGPLAVAPRLTHIAVTTGCRHSPRGQRCMRASRSFALRVARSSPSPTAFFFFYNALTLPVQRKRVYKRAILGSMIKNLNVHYRHHIGFHIIQSIICRCIIAWQPSIKFSHLLKY